jgi:cytochrome c oxidase assembly protein subunit 15
VERRLVLLSRALVGAAAVVVLTGTVVTAAGPHAGDESARRLDVAVADVARVHGTSVVLLLLLTLATLWVADRTSAPEVVQTSLRTFLVVLVVQGAIGYVQYFTGVPAALVGAHVLGAVGVWIAVLRVSLVTREPVPAAAPTSRAVAPTRRAALTAT